MSARVVVVGAGVSGLATAYRLLREAPGLDVTVLEAARSAGGKLSARFLVGGLELEGGPDSFVARKPWAVELCRELGLELTEPRATDAYMWTDRGLIPLPPTAMGIPADLDQLARWPGLSRRGRARALTDLVRRARPAHTDVSIGSLVRRRMGDEVVTGLTGPLLAGLFAGDVDRLSVGAAFPELARWERDFGSLIRGARTAAKVGHDAGPMFLRPVGGVSRLPGALLEAIGDARVTIDTPARTIERTAGTFTVRTQEEDVPADAVVLATPASASSELLAGIDPAASGLLGQIAYVSTGVVLLVYADGTADALPDASGFVVPHGRAPMTAATFLSRKWPDPSFGTRAVVRCFVGAAGFEEVLDAPDGDIVEALYRHVAAVLPLPDRPEASVLVRWPRAMPQFEVGHLERVRAIETALPPGIFVTGNAYLGVGVADAVRSASEVAERVRGHLEGQPVGSERAR